MATAENNLTYNIINSVQAASDAYNDDDYYYDDYYYYDDSDFDWETFESASVGIWKYGGPPIYILGLVGNVLTIAVLLHARYSRLGRVLHTFDFYLIVLSLADTLALVTTALTKYLSLVFKINLTTKSAIGCAMLDFLYLTSIQYAVWVVCAVSLDRLIRIKFPFWVSRKTQYRSAIAACSILLVLMVLINIPWTAYMTYTGAGEMVTDSDNRTAAHAHEQASCTPTEDSGFLRVYATNLYPWLFFTVYSFAPFIIITTTNTLLILELRRRNKRFSAANRESAVNSPATQHSIRMLVPMCIVFLLTTLPVTITNIYGYWSLEIRKPPLQQGIEKVVNSVATFLTNFNHGTNFVVYGLAGSTFRKLLIFLFRRGQYLVYDTYTSDGKLTPAMYDDRIIKRIPSMARMFNTNGGGSSHSTSIQSNLMLRQKDRLRPTDAASQRVRADSYSNRRGEFRVLTIREPAKRRGPIQISSTIAESSPLIGEGRAALVVCTKGHKQRCNSVRKRAFLAAKPTTNRSGLNSVAEDMELKPVVPPPKRPDYLDIPNGASHSQQNGEVLSPRAPLCNLASL